MRDWFDIYSRELVEVPPADEMVAHYLGYKPPGAGAEEAEIPEAMLLPEIEA